MATLVGGCHLNLPVVINEMRSKNHNFQFKLIRVGFESKHDGGELGVVCSVTCCHTNSQLLVALDKINAQMTTSTKMKRRVKMSTFPHILSLPHQNIIIVIEQLTWF